MDLKPGPQRAFIFSIKSPRYHQYLLLYSIPDSKHIIAQLLWLLISPGVSGTLSKFLIKEVISCLFHFVTSSFLVWQGSCFTWHCCSIISFYCWFLDYLLLLFGLVFCCCSFLAFSVNALLLIIN